MLRKKKLSRGLIFSIISAAAVCITSAAILITNLFIPVKYFTAYVTLKKDPNAAGDMRVTFIDVGYGDSTLIEFPDGKTALIDAGNGRVSSEQKILKVLNERQIDNIDCLICSSVSTVRCGGFAELLKYKTASAVYMPNCFSQINKEFRTFCEAVQKAKADVGYCRYGAIEINDSFTFCFLSPSASGSEYNDLNSEPSEENINDASAIIWLEYKGAGFLLTGDASSERLQKMCLSYQLNGYLDVGGNYVSFENCTLLKAGGHGSKNSVYAPLYDLAKPDMAIISVGENARGYPSIEALAAAQRYAGDKLYRTDLNGTVTVTVHEDGEVTVKEK